MRIGSNLNYGLLMIAIIGGLGGCNDNADTDGDGTVSSKERAVEMNRDGYLALAPGRWQHSVTFTEIDVPKLAAAQKQKIIEAAGKESLHYSCLSKAEAAKPGPDFFGGAGSENCTYQKFDLAGNQADMAISCQMGNMGKTDMELSGKVGTDDFNFDTKVIVHLPMIGKSRTIKMAGTMTGKNMGACTGDE